MLILDRFQAQNCSIKGLSGQISKNFFQVCAVVRVNLKNIQKRFVLQMIFWRGGSLKTKFTPLGFFTC